MTKHHSEISSLTPQPLWQFFDQICSIPHPSKEENALAEYIVGWAKAQGLETRRDSTGNIFIKKPATAGMENRKGVILQAHIDMVPQKNEDTAHNFSSDPIQPYIDGEWVTARGTTLGADNGIGMASCLAVLAADNISHGPLEVLLTVDEEAGMTGAFGLEKGWLEGDILLNTDSEQEGEVYMGCAGGVDTTMTFTLQREELPTGFSTRRLTIKGLKGGHSGCDIHLGRGNANKLMGRFLAGHAEELNLRLIDFHGGTLRNAIPREVFATVAVPVENEGRLNELFTHYANLIKAELSRVETDIVSFYEVSEDTTPAFTAANQARFIAALNTCPNGVLRMSDEVEGVVETSLNVGVIKTEGNEISIRCLIRSLIDSGREQVQSTFASLAQLSGAEITVSGAYSGWKPDADSEIMQIFRDTYEGLYGNKPRIMVIHAGLECGLFKKAYPEMDMVSFGPTIKFPHSPDEKVEIKAVALYWEQLVAVLGNIPEKK